tara:strand:+ start:278 stop:703 length:426 start_codon:yes stop_codon:yes gene_type:complete
MIPLSLFQIGLKESLFYKDSIIKHSFIPSKMNSINLFPVEEKQTLKADKLNISFCFASYSSSLTIRDNNKELTIYLNEKTVMDHVLNSITNLNVSYASNRDYMIELFKKVVVQIDKMETKDKEAMATYLVNNLNTTSEVNN